MAKKAARKKAPGNPIGEFGVADPDVEQIGEAADEPRDAIASGITFPIARPDPGHCPRYVNTELTRRQGAALKAILAACYTREECEVRNARGSQPVSNYGNCVRWLLDRVADAHEEATGEKLLDNQELVF